MNNYKIHDVVRMKKAHPCGENRWEIIRYGADVKLQCLKCNRVVLIERPKFIKNVKKKLNDK